MKNIQDILQYTDALLNELSQKKPSFPKISIISNVLHVYNKNICETYIDFSSIFYTAHKIEKAQPQQDNLAKIKEAFAISPEIEQSLITKLNQISAVTSCTDALKSVKSNFLEIISPMRNEQKLKQVKAFKKRFSDCLIILESINSQFALSALQILRSNFSICKISLDIINTKLTKNDNEGLDVLFTLVKNNITYIADFSEASKDSRISVDTTLTISTHEFSSYKFLSQSIVVAGLGATQLNAANIRQILEASGVLIDNMCKETVYVTAKIIPQLAQKELLECLKIASKIDATLIFKFITVHTEYGNYEIVSESIVDLEAKMKLVEESKSNYFQINQKDIFVNNLYKCKLNLHVAQGQLQKVSQAFESYFKLTNNSPSKSIGEKFYTCGLDALMAINSIYSLKKFDELLPFVPFQKIIEEMSKLRKEKIEYLDNLDKTESVEISDDTKVKYEKVQRQFESSTNPQESSKYYEAMLELLVENEKSTSTTVIPSAKKEFLQDFFNYFCLGSRDRKYSLILRNAISKTEKYSDIIYYFHESTTQFLKCENLELEQYDDLTNFYEEYITTIDDKPLANYIQRGLYSIYALYDDTRQDGFKKTLKKHDPLFIMDIDIACTQDASIKTTATEFAADSTFVSDITSITTSRSSNFHSDTSSSSSASNSSASSSLSFPPNRWKFQHTQVEESSSSSYKGIRIKTRPEKPMLTAFVINNLKTNQQSNNTACIFSYMNGRDKVGDGNVFAVKHPDLNKIMLCISLREIGNLKLDPSLLTDVFKIAIAAVVEGTCVAKGHNGIKCYDNVVVIKHLSYSIRPYGLYSDRIKADQAGGPPLVEIKYSYAK